jgi:hypothetical protein
VRAAAAELAIRINAARRHGLHVRVQIEDDEGECALGDFVIRIRRDL